MALLLLFQFMRLAVHNTTTGLLAVVTSIHTVIHHGSTSSLFHVHGFWAAHLLTYISEVVRIEIMEAARGKL